MLVRWKNPVPPLLCAAGATALEYALLLPLLLILVLGTIEYCVMEFAAIQLDAGVSEMARQGQTGQLAGTPYTPANMNAALMAQLVPSYLFNTSQLNVSVENFDSYQVTSCSSYNPCYPPSEFQGVNYSTPTTVGFPASAGTSGVGNAGNVVLYSATYQWTGITPVWNLISFVFGTGSSNGTTLVSNLIVQNEPFPSTSR